MISPEEPHHPLLSEAAMLDRRSVMGGLGLAGLGLLFSSTAADAVALQKGAEMAPKVIVQTKKQGTSPVAELPQIDLSDLPEQWLESQGPSLPSYARYLTGLKLKSISPRQVIEAHAKSKFYVWNTLPPKRWWTRMGYTLRVADRIALEMNVKEVEVISAYRSPAYNANCEGAKVGSWHQANVAVDVKFPVRPGKVAAAARNLRERGLFKGGVGGYWNFTHIDTRGQNINW
jgi:hypothetical protein